MGVQEFLKLIVYFSAAPRGVDNMTGRRPMVTDLDTHENGIEDRREVVLPSVTDECKA